jgi:hypoxanthine phosphoribosyltransferase
MLLARNPRSFRIITLLDKPSRRTSPIEADMTLFTIEDKFVLGYGLDYAEKYRNLPDIEYIET